MKNGEERAVYGEGSVYETKAGYTAQIWHTVEVDGKKYAKRISGSGKTASKAVRRRNKNILAWEQELKQSLKAASMVAEEPAEEDSVQNPTLNEVFAMNMKRIKTRAQAPTYDNYEVYYDGYVKDSPLGHTGILDIPEEQLLEFYETTRLAGRKRKRRNKDGSVQTPKPLSISTLNHIRFVIANTFQFAFEKHIIKENPHLNIGPFKSGTAAMIDYEQEDMDEDSDDEDALQKVIPLEEMDRVLDYAFRHSRLAGLFAWAVNSGMREGECLGLKRQCIMEEGEYVLVKKSLAYIKDRREGAKSKYIPKLKKPKNGKERKIPYNQNLQEIFLYQEELIKKEKRKAGKLYVDKGLVFADEYGGFLRPWKVLKEFQSILEKVGVEKHRFHDLRHTFVSLMVKESQKSGDGVSILDVCAIVGHSDPTVTLKIYGGLFPNSSKRAMQVLEGCKAIQIPKRDEKEAELAG